MKRIRGKITYANVMATLAVFLVLGGGAYAATALPKNSVGPKQLKKNAVTTAKIKNRAVTGAKIKLSSVGTVPSAERANTAAAADTANRAATAVNADSLGGVPANRYVRPGSVLASGETEAGIFATSGPNTGYGLAAINFTQKLPAPVLIEQAQVLGEGATSAECPGPRQAAPGHFCVYLTSVNSMSFQSFASSFPSAGPQVVEPEGTVLLFASTADNSNVRGTYAYTAP